MNEAQIGAAAAPAFDAGAGGIRQRFFPDYNAAATLYWAVLVAAGVTAAGFCALRVSLLSSANISQVLAIGLVAAVVGMFPLHPPKQQGTKRADHLAKVTIPMLFLQGTRDALADLKLLRPICAKLSSRATLHIIESADHSFHVLKSSGKTDEQVLRELAETAASWAEGFAER